MKKVSLFIFLLVLLFFTAGSSVLAQPTTYSECLTDGNPAESCCGLTGSPETCDEVIHVFKPTGAIGSINSLISGGVTLILIVAGLVAFVYLLLGGIKWITSGGDSAQVEAARNQVIHAMIGIIVVLAAWGLIMLIQGATGACFGIGCTIELPVFT
ncbi:hypothetical protein HY469_04835 [Candidatus Roizmanbacteria bacterium]|nr:hypothetical protein [Candidatus Roizmanbacteria bacterium]